MMLMMLIAAEVFDYVYLLLFAAFSDTIDADYCRY